MKTKRQNRSSTLLLPVTMLLASVSCGQQGAKPAPSAKVLDSAFAGSWYPADPARLSQNIQSYLDHAKEELLPDVHALILPHAGYRFSGPVAGYGIKQVAGQRFDRVIVMGPSHRLARPNTACLPDAAAFRTPLGEIPLDRECIDRLLNCDAFQIVPGVHEGEHSVQMELPLLQAALKDFRLVPIVVGQLDEAATRRIADALLANVDDRTLVVVSSDFTHFGPNYGYKPFSSDIAKNLEQLDMGAYQTIAAKDSAALRSYCDRTHDTICGLNPIAVLLDMLPAGDQAHLLKYDTSGNITANYKNSVSYLAIAFTGHWKAPAQQPDSGLSAADRQTLLKLARDTLNYYFARGRAPTPADLGIDLSAPMQAERGAFVTLTEQGQLRGCIGDIFPRRPLYQAVMGNALNAALRDPRFRPVSRNELAALHLEISVLTPPQPVESYKDIVIGRDGVVLSKNGHKAVYLPQVAPEQGWGIEETLQHLSRKAGLPSDAWRQGTRFQIFQADVFDEAER
ncbi:MAG: AmmeMemoRadiSam system protein B [Kiritimatiellaeota bacterium]|nr:AmmeMemoRadiSam system protein B [Kiritimatiellota bacterium]